MALWTFEPVAADLVALMYRDARNGIHYECGRTRRPFNASKVLREFIVLHADPFDVLVLPEGGAVAFLPRAKETA